jgi:hypothetical protein
LSSDLQLIREMQVGSASLAWPASQRAA